MDNLPIRILIVEDDIVIATMLKEIVQEIGCTPVGPVQSTSGALDIVAVAKIDAAILDMDIEGGSSLSVANELYRLGKPWIFTTGRGCDVSDDCYPDVQRITKPFVPKYISAVISKMLVDRASRDGHPRRTGHNPGVSACQ